MKKSWKYIDENIIANCWNKAGISISQCPAIVENIKDTTTSQFERECLELDFDLSYRVDDIELTLDQFIKIELSEEDKVEEFDPITEIISHKDIKNTLMLFKDASFQLEVPI